jgi:hypothetical protein
MYLLVAIFFGLVTLIVFLNSRTRSTSTDKGQVSESWLAANRVSSRTGE